MIITLTGNAASGKSTVAKVLAKKLGLRHYSTGDFMRQMAEERGLTLAKFGVMAQGDSRIDKVIDKWSKNLGKTEEGFILDTRLGWYFIPKSIKIFLFVGRDEQARRLMLDKRVAEKFKDEKDAIKQIIKREQSERLRYKKYYNLDYMDKKHYDLWIDTTKSNVELIVERILKFLQDLKNH